MRVMPMTQPGESDESGARGGKVSHGSAVTHAHQWGKLCMAISTTERGTGREKSGVVKSQSFCDSLLPQFGLTCIPGSYLDDLNAPICVTHQVAFEKFKQ